MNLYNIIDILNTIRNLYDLTVYLFKVYKSFIILIRSKDKFDSLWYIFWEPKLTN